MYEPCLTEINGDNCDALRKQSRNPFFQSIRDSAELTGWSGGCSPFDRANNAVGPCLEYVSSAKLFATHESIGKWIAKHPARIRLHDLNWTPLVRVSEKPATLNRRNSKTFCVAFQLFSRRNRWPEFPRPRSRCEHRMQNNLSRRSSISWVLRCYWPVISWNCTSVDLNAPVRWNYNFLFFLFFHSQQNSIIKLISMGRAFSGILFSLF